MAFTATIQNEIHIGGTRIVNGYYTNSAGSTGGAIKTGLGTVYTMVLTQQAAAVSTNGHVVSSTTAFPISATDGSVTIITNSNESGSFVAIGR